ncbi:MAG: hypothetical protein EPN72_05260 [Nevskiaceae bacterium]|nr:MAG: hypothetical protein EPN63_03935 [Nevskiaceae bacterium]TBR73547.1 MAG: hypothetical protein EPN72_05260 [Nevskiaceae bacterium]
MTRRFQGIALASCLFLGACATQPQYGAQDKAATQPLIKDYHTCLNQQAVAMVNGSDDVTLITRVVLRNCNDRLQAIGNYLKGRGFDDPFISRYLSNLHQQAGDSVESFILRVKSHNATPGRTSTAPL